MQAIKSFILGRDNRIKSDSYLWNMLAGLLNAGQSVIILMVITRTNSVFDAGIFTIAYATANLFLTIGNYGMRSFQVTDVSRHYNVSDYLGSRILTGTVMMFVSIGYVLYGISASGYSMNKAGVILVICLLKLVDAIEDIFHGMYQQNNRLDIGAKCITIRLSVTITTLCMMLVWTKNLLLSSVISTMVSIGILCVFTRWTLPSFEIGKLEFSIVKIRKLLISCFAVFAAAFLSFYILNAPKYAIDNYLSQDMQAYYGFIAMPVFVVGLLNNFLYQPILTSLAVDWLENRKSIFIKRICKQLMVIVGLTIVTLLGADLIGIPVLSKLYHTDLSLYKSELLILLLGGGILAVVGFTTIVLTIIRHQKDLISGYIVVAVLAYLLSPYAVQQFGITGASWIYTILVGILAIIFGIVLVYRVHKGS